MTVTDYPSFTQTKEFRSGVEIETNFQVEDTTRMSVDTQGAAHIMSLLTDLYGDPEGSVIREYISNAYDSHAAAGQTKPVEVTLPTPFEPKFVIKDFGTGMTATEVREIYGSYGRSTKRNDFTQVGAFGLGCKSALTMTQQFSLVAIKNGERTVAIVTRGEDGVGEIKIISVTETEDSNGVTVSIPVTDVNKFNGKANDFFFTLPKDSIVVNGEMHTKNLYSGDYTYIPELKTHISRKPLVGNGWYSKPGGLHVIAGGVSYKVDFSEIANDISSSARGSALYNNFDNQMNFKVYTEIPISSIDLTPSREGIRYSNRSKEFLAGIFNAVSARFIEVITSDITLATNRTEALTRLFGYETYVSARYLTDVKWNGEVIPRTVSAPRGVISAASYASSTSVSYADDLNFKSYVARPGNTSYYIVADVSGASNQDEALREVVEKNRRNFRAFLKRDEEVGTLDPIEVLTVFKNELPTSPWFTELTNFTPITLDEIAEGAKKWRKWRRTQASVGRGVVDPITYPTFTLSDDSLEVASLPGGDVDAEALFIEEGVSAMFDNRRHTDIEKFMEDLEMEGTQIVYVSKSRKVSALEKRSKSTHKSLVAVLRERFDKALAGLSENAKGLLSLQNTRSVNSALELVPHADKIDDEDLKTLAAAATETDAFHVLFDAVEKVHPTSLGRSDGTDTVYKIVTDLNDRYPLLGLTNYVSCGNIEHSIIYMNTIHSLLEKDA